MEDKKLWKEPDAAHIVLTARKLKVAELIENGEELPGYMGDTPIQYNELNHPEPELAWCRAVLKRMLKTNPKGALNITFLDWYWYQQKSDEEIEAYLLEVRAKVKAKRKK